jgi:adenosine deaminase
VIVINANVEKLSPLDVEKLAELTVAYRGRGVIGFATTSAEIKVAQMRYFERTFAYLKENFIPVTIFAGETDAETVPSALVRGHARRIAGAFAITKSESLLNDVTSHNTVVLISLGVSAPDAVQGWKRSLVRLFSDFGVKLGFCSIHQVFAGMSRSKQLFTLAEQAGFDALVFLQFLDRTFASAFAPYHERLELLHDFWAKSRELLAEHGFPAKRDYTYFPPLE